MKTYGFMAVLGLGLVAAGCGSESAAAGSGSAAAPAEATGAAQAPAVPTGNVVEVKMVTDGQANYFEPAELTVRPGDVVRFTLTSGLHNVSFPADKNAGAAGLPQASPFLQQPGQSHDVQIDLAPGTYHFQCDPHVMMGMVGKLTVQ